MFGFVSMESVVPRALLRDAPRSLQTLSHAHPDGWGIALRAADDWVVHRGTACAARCERYAELVDAAESRLLVAHIRQKTRGETKLANTHPFRRGAFVFAHNGTVTDTAPLVAHSSPARLAEIEGETDSERLFAFVLTHLDRAGDVEAGVIAAVRELHGIAGLGSASFLLSCGARIYAHRLGRSLFTIVRHAAAVPAAGAQRRTAAVVVASEQLTDELWTELPERALVVIDPAGARTLAL
ncbi:MAG: class II glutamine amidotransferase [Proteobacteria bacterium]|nr:class II glutamine amidotransferase [Pseudomonadota bacterium]